MDGTIRLWPIPEGRPPMYYEHDEFLDYLRSQTNVRIVPDTSKATGFSITQETFRGWDALPK